MKVLVTGSTAQQASKIHVERTPTFSNLLVRSFKDAGIDAQLSNPNLNWDEQFLSEFDLVVVGIAPTTSISANKIYPALITAEKARNIGNLALLIDAPESYKLLPSFRAWQDMDKTLKSFYDRRKNYSDVATDENLQAQLKSFITHLCEDPWPTTFFPTFPWSTKDYMIKNISNLDSESLVGVSVDMYVLLQPPKVKNFYASDEYWTCDSMSPFGKEQQKLLNKPVLSTKSTIWESENETLTRIRESIGTLVATYRGGESWWSPALSQSLSQGVPVVHDWRYTGYMGEEWTHLASTVENMSMSEREELAYSQKQSYLSNLPDQDQVSESLNKTIKQLV